MSEFLFVYITASSENEAEKIARALVEENLAACANIFPFIHSIYKFEGGLHQNIESVLILKVKSDNFKTLDARVRELHSYSCPCVVAMPISQGSVPYLEWLRAS